jgi:small-conductance mechanosensitive channel
LQKIQIDLQERKDLAFTLKDTKTIVGKLETILGFAIHILFIILYLVVFSVDVSKAWISFSSIIVAFSFIFSKAISDLFLAVVFLFVVHPFDVGDGIMIGTDMHFVSPSHLQCPGSHRLI